MYTVHAFVRLFVAVLGHRTLTMSHFKATRYPCLLPDSGTVLSEESTQSLRQVLLEGLSLVQSCAAQVEVVPAGTVTYLKTSEWLGSIIPTFSGSYSSPSNWGQV